VVVKSEEVKKANLTERLDRKKRQVQAVGGGLGLGFGAYDYNDYYGDYIGDYAYDYYDWICTDTACQLCDILTSDCCDPAYDRNCYLPDSCMNNPCLSGGTCISSKTIDNRPDFICACLPGLTGKYCQLANDYFVGAEAAIAASPVVPRPSAFVPSAAPVAPAVQYPTYQKSYQQTYQQPSYSPYQQYAAAQPQMSQYLQQQYQPSAYQQQATFGGFAQASPYSTQQLSFQTPSGNDGAFNRNKRSLSDDILNMLNEHEFLLNSLDDEFSFNCDDCGSKGVCRHVLWENGTVVEGEKFCQCSDLTFGSKCPGTRVNCQSDAHRRTSAGRHASRDYFIECTHKKPNVIKCAEQGSIYNPESKTCGPHSLKLKSNEHF
jgi:hypothetical protein